MILLDTNIVVAFLNGDNSILKRIKDEIDRIALSSLVVAELDYGAKASQRGKENLEELYCRPDTPVSILSLPLRFEYV